MLRLLPLCVLVAGCGNDLPVASFVEKIRVLAVRAEPPEAQPNEAVALDALVVQPPRQQLDGSAPSPTSYLWLACSIPPGTASQVPCGLSPDRAVTTGAGGIGPVPLCTDQPSASLCLLGTNATATYQPPATGSFLISLTVADTAEGAAACLIAAADSGGLPQNPDHCVFAIKRLTVSTRSAAERNHNPAIDGFAMSGNAEDPAPATLYDGKTTFTLAPDVDPPSYTLSLTRMPGSAELDLRPDPNDTAQTPRMIPTKEALALSWFTTAGEINGGRSTFTPPNCASQADCPADEPVLYARTRWTAPTAETSQLTLLPDGVATFYAVLRDDRGGVTWQTGTAVLAK
jgi:hypothetical protein